MITSVPERLFSPASVYLTVCLSVNRITQKLTIKSSCNYTEWLDIICGPIVQVLVVIWILIGEFLKEFYHCDIGNCKGCSSGVRQQSQITQANRPQIQQSKGCLGPRAGSGVVRIDPLRFIAGCHARQLNPLIICLSIIS